MWRVREVQIWNLSKTASALQFLEEIACQSHLDRIERSFILQVMQTHLEKDPVVAAQFFMPWAVVASRGVQEFGLEEVKHLVDTLTEGWKDSRVSLDVGNEMFMKTLVDLLSWAMELESIQEVVAVLVLPKRSWFGPPPPPVTVSSWMQQIQAKISASRGQRLAEDHPVEEVICRFRSQTFNPEDFRPHLFSFDGTPVFPLADDELQQLLSIMTAAVHYKVPHNAAELKLVAINCASEFKKDRSLPSLGWLLACLREAFLQVTSKQPFVIQCMCVAGFLLHQLNEQKRQGLKGRLAQMATGEGKSMVVCMLSLANALQGRSVDIVTSTQSLASRDCEESRPIYDFFGVTSSVIAVEQPTEHHFNGQVLFGTNTDFEFARLRDGAYLSQVCRTQGPDGQWGHRKSDVVIVDESDSLFLDAASSSARLAHQTGTNHTWLYAPIFDMVKASTEIPEVQRIRAVLKACEGGIHEASLKQIDDSKLKVLAEKARKAMVQCVLGQDYVVQGGEVQIVDVDTGRLQPSCRWSKGLHEMVEVKEGIKVKPENGTIASISHPSFFDDYVTIFGITGTVGEQAEREEIQMVYRLDSFDVPPHRPCQRKLDVLKIFQPAHSKRPLKVQEGN